MTIKRTRVKWMHWLDRTDEKTEPKLKGDRSPEPIDFAFKFNKKTRESEPTSIIDFERVKGSEEFQTFVQTYFAEFDFFELMQRTRLVCESCLCPITDDQFIILPDPFHPSNPLFLKYFHASNRCDYRKKKVKIARERWRRTHLQPAEKSDTEE